MHTGDVQHITRTSGVGQEVILIIEENMFTLHEVFRGIEIIIITTEGMVTEVKITIEIGVGH